MSIAGALFASLSMLALINLRVGERLIGPYLRAAWPQQLNAATAIALGTVLPTLATTGFAWLIDAIFTREATLSMQTGIAMLMLLAAGITTLVTLRHDQDRLVHQALRRFVMLAVGNGLLILGLSAILSASSHLPEAALAVTLSLSFALLLPALAALHYRVDVPTLPACLRGTPVAVLNSGLIGSALYGLGRVFFA